MDWPQSTLTYSRSSSKIPLFSRSDKVKDPDHTLQLCKPTRRGVFYRATEEHRKGSFLEFLPRPEHYRYCYKVIKLP